MRIDVDLGALRADAPDGLTLALQPGEADVARSDGCTLVLAGWVCDGAGGTELDAAALLARYRAQGVDMAAGLHGAYALAVVDAPARRVLLANDRMGQRSWCHAGTGRRLRISDRADTIADGAELDPQALFAYLFHHVIPAPATVFRGVTRLPAGHRWLAESGRHEVQPHWTPAFQPDPAPDFERLADDFRRRLRAAVARSARRLGGDGLGCFLSGGTDSSTVAGLLARELGQPVSAYSIGFDAEGYDEMAYARIAARHFGLQHREYYLTRADVADGMPAVAAHYDQPFGNSSAVAAFHCARVARDDGLRALLAGDGGDELFGGNARYAKQALFGLYDRVPGPLRAGLLQPLLDNPLGHRLPGVKKAASYVQQARVPMPDRLQMYNLLVRLGLGEVLEPGFLAAVDPAVERAAQRTEYARTRGATGIDRQLAFDWKYTLADNDLPKVLGTTGLAGIGTAFPLLDDALIDFSLRLPADYKLRGQRLRWFFKEALRDLLPQEILVKRKQGFGLPFGVWALSDARLGGLVGDALGAIAGRGIVRPSFVSTLRGTLLPSHPGYYGELVWILVMLEFWLRRHRPDFRQPT
jgi:asparagine synthase (glutamine-hydrolysing)